MSSSLQRWSIVCYGNILRSQVLEQYLRAYCENGLVFFSAGISGKDEFSDKEALFSEIRQEMAKRNVTCNLERNFWSDEIAEKIISSDLVLCAGSGIKEEVLKRTGPELKPSKVFTFYGFIGEGEQDFEDTYDYEKGRQDPVRFRKAFDELDRIAKKMLKIQVTE